MIGTTEKIQMIQLVQPKMFKSNYEFRVDDKVVGEIRYQGFAGRKAEATLYNEKYKFQQTGFWKTFIEYKAEQSPYDKGKLHAKMSCVIEIADRNNTKYTFKKAAWWKTCWGWYDQAGNEVIKFKQPVSLKKQAEITINDPKIVNKPLLILLGTVIFIINKRAASATMFPGYINS